MLGGRDERDECRNTGGRHQAPITARAAGQSGIVLGSRISGEAARAVFAVMTLLFVATGIAILAGGLDAPPAHSGHITHTTSHPAAIAVLLAFPVAMALASGVEAPQGERWPALEQTARMDELR